MGTSVTFGECSEISTHDLSLCSSDERFNHDTIGHSQWVQSRLVVFIGIYSHLDVILHYEGEGDREGTGNWRKSLDRRPCEQVTYRVARDII